MALPILYLLFWPVSFEPVAFTPVPIKAWQSNGKLGGAELMPLGKGPEDVVFDEKGRLYTGLDDGRILRAKADGSAAETFANTGGRPLGLLYESKGSLLVADAEKGLLRVTKGKVKVLSSELAGRPFILVDDVDKGPDGTIFFTDASQRHHVHDANYDIFEHQRTGRVLTYKEGVTKVLMTDLQFANGVKLSHDRRSLLVNETGERRILRHWLKGPKKGTTVDFVSGLPGHPDNIDRGEDGLYGVALAAPASKMLNLVAAWPRVRKAIYRLPRAALPLPPRHGWVMAFDEKGKVVHDLQDVSGRLAITTSATPHDGWLYMGSYVEPHLARIKLP